jgi:hypothetical protein
MIGLLTSALLEAATIERDLRLERAPRALAESGADREAIVISCQCWSAIVTWLDTDKFESFVGGESSDGPVIRWPELEAAAERALRGAKQGTEAERVQRARLTAVHARLQRMRADVDWLNAEFKKPREEIAA